MTPRPYQLEAMEALDEHLCSKEGNPCVVLPTGSGKTPVMAWTIHRWAKDQPRIRVCVLAHIRELLAQGVSKLQEIWPEAPVGVYSAGMGKKESDAQILYAGIQSVWNKAFSLEPFDAIFIDEAHRLPLHEDGQYRKFIADCRMNNPRLRVVGFTATPYRLDGGKICGPDFVLNEVCYDANVKTLIDEGYLSKLRTKVSKIKINLKGVKKSNGDFNAKDLAEKYDPLVDAIAEEAALIFNHESRKSILAFCCTIEHADRMSSALTRFGVEAKTISSLTTKQERDCLTEQFKLGQIRCLVNVNVLSEGFDARRVDGIVLIRPTESAGLYYQQIGRGLRLHPDKTDGCLILDYSGNINRHGAIDTLKGAKTLRETCEQCDENYPAVFGKCPACGWMKPKEEREMLEGVDRVRNIPNNPKFRTEKSVLSGEPWEMLVESATAQKWAGKEGKPPTLCVTYFGGIERHREWICLEHPVGFAQQKAAQWWRNRFGEPIPRTIDEALATDLFLGQSIADKTQAVQVTQDGQYTKILGYRFQCMLRY